jgi:hypothetical protein
MPNVRWLQFARQDFRKALQARQHKRPELRGFFRRPLSSLFTVAVYPLLLLCLSPNGHKRAEQSGDQNDWPHGEVSFRCDSD